LRGECTTISVEEYAKKRSRYIQGCYPNIFPVPFVEGKGIRLKGLDGKEYIDFFAGIAVNNAGYCHPTIVKAIQTQSNLLGHVLWHNLPMVQLAEEIASLAPKGLSKVYLCNSGNEAVEAVVKLSKKYAVRSGKVGSHVVVLDHAFHGRGGLTLSLTGESAYKHGMGIFANYPGVTFAPTPYCYRCQLECPSCGFECAAKIDDILNYHLGPENIACVIVEPVLGEGGIIVPPDGYLERVQKSCKTAGVTFVLDEVQTGFGRTGKMFASEHWGLGPDIISMGKALGGGLPLAGMIATEAVNSAWSAGDHATTFSSNPICCVAGLAMIKVIREERLVENSAKVGKYIIKEIKAMTSKNPKVGDVRGLGLMIGVELVKDVKTKEPAKEEATKVKEELFKKGLIIGTGGIRKNMLRLQPPLTITMKDADILLDALDETLKAI